MDNLRVLNADSGEFLEEADLSSLKTMGHACFGKCDFKKLLRSNFSNLKKLGRKCFKGISLKDLLNTEIERNGSVAEME